jgi:hypothetical protein
MSIFFPTEFPLDNLTTVLNSQGQVSVNTSYKNSATNNSVPVFLFIQVWG